VLPYADLHSHTTASDGALSPEALTALAARRGVRVLAVTDHDTTSGLERAAEGARSAGISLVTGIEISAFHTREVHILGHFIDPVHPGLLAALSRRAEERRARVREIAARLDRVGAPIDADALLAEAAARSTNVGRPHIARALLAAGHVATVEEAFRTYLGRDGSAYVPVPRFEAASAIALVHDAGGAATLAHPGIEGIDDHLPALADSGLDGLEIRHPAHDGERVARYAGLAGLLRLCPTGGSDFHGPDGPPWPGDHTVGPETLAALRARAPRPFDLA
jgi:predicted metal-dependent phosphoesterase TrpH